MILGSEKDDCAREAHNVLRPSGCFWRVLFCALRAQPSQEGQNEKHAPGLAKPLLSFMDYEV